MPAANANWVKVNYLFSADLLFDWFVTSSLASN